VLANLHTLGYVYKWSVDGSFIARLKHPSITLRCVALACLNVMALTSSQHMRTKSYRMFSYAHFFGLACFLPALCGHNPIVIPYVLAAVGIYGMDHICRLMRLRIYSAQIEAFPGVSMTRIIVPYINYGWSEGQHVRVRLLPGSGLPCWMFLEVHPFVIASIPNSYDGLVLVCYARGRLDKTAVRFDSGTRIARKLCSCGHRTRRTIRWFRILLS